MAYRREDIERVRAATNLVELVGEVTKVKRSGRNSMAVCPFHQEKTPSMSVDAARGLYHCFGCGESGDVFRFVEQTQGLGFTDALELLAKRSGITLELDPKAKARRGKREPLIEAIAYAVEFYHLRLRKAEDGAAARKYLRARGYDAGVVEQFSLGYSPDDFTALTAHLRDRKVPDKVMVEAGLAGRGRGGRLYDRFRGRVMFPIFDVRGDAVGFGARLLEGEGPKYLNSPETPVYRKSQLLYGLNWAKSDMVRRGVAVVVEGYTDVIAVHRAGFPVAVATCGTALGESHLDLLRRFTGRVILAFDADEAGAGAALRGFELAVPADLDLRVAPLPDGRDPADLVEDGMADKLAGAIESSIPLLQFRIEKELDKYPLDEPEARGRAVRAATRLIAAHPDPVTRHEYAVFVSRHTGVDLEVVRQALGRPVPRPEAPGTGRSAAAVTESLSGRQRGEREYLRLLLVNDPQLDRTLPATAFSEDLHRRSFQLMIEQLGAIPPGDLPDLGALLPADETGDFLRRLALVPGPLADPSQVSRRLRRNALDDRLTELRVGLDELDPEGPEYRRRLEEILELEREKRLLKGP